MTVRLTSPFAMDQPTQVTFATGHSSSAIFPADLTTLHADLQKMGFNRPAPTIVVIGGAKEMSVESRDRVQKVFQEVIAPLAEELDAIVVDGGTDDGVMQMMGMARQFTASTFSLVGVAPIGKIKLPSASESAQGTYLEPHHTHFVLIPGERWGDESPWLAQVASVLAKENPSITLLINGGKVALIDLAENIAVGRPAVILAGSGRLADDIAEAVRDPLNVSQEAIAELLPKGQFAIFDLTTPLSHLAQLLKQHLYSPQATS